MWAVTLRQPWASLVAVGAKTVETRSWSTKHRRPLAIHAGAKRPPAHVQNDVNDDLPPAIDLVSMGRNWRWTEHRDDSRHGGIHQWIGPLGVIVATAQLVDCMPIITEVDDEPDGPFVYADAGNFLQVHDGPSDPVPFYNDWDIHLGDFSPGRYAWLLDDIKPTSERCPACWGSGWEQAGTIPTDYGNGIEHDGIACPVCSPDGIEAGAGRCAPIPARGHQGLWAWEPS